MILRRLSEAIRQQDCFTFDVKPQRIEWVGIMWSTLSGMGEQNEAAARAVAVINAELERR